MQMSAKVLKIEALIERLFSFSNVAFIHATRAVAAMRPASRGVKLCVHRLGFNSYQRTIWYKGQLRLLLNEY